VIFAARTGHINSLQCRIVTEPQRYVYWSERRVRSLLGDNDLGFETRNWKRKIVLALPRVVSVEFAEDRRTKTRNEIADEITTFLGDAAVRDYMVPPPIRYASGRDRVEFAHFTGNSGTIVTYSERTLADSRRVGICMFGSRDNLRGFIGADDTLTTEWSSSAWHAIVDVLRSRGAVNNSQWDDDESISVEVFKVATEQGRSASSNTGEPWTRGYTIGNATDAEWLGEVYLDAELTPSRWRNVGVDRIITGALLWARTRPGNVTTYSRLRQSLANTVL
jgi:hypothetical protein